MEAKSEIQDPEKMSEEPERIIDITCNMKKETYRIIWNIDGFNMMPFFREHPLFGPTIRLGKDEESTWQLIMCKERGEDDKLPSLGCKLIKIEDNTVWDVCRYDVTLSSRLGDVRLVMVKNGLAGGEEDFPYIYVKGSKEKVYLNEDGQEQSGEDSPLKDKSGKVEEEVDPETDRKLKALFKEPVLVVECDIRYTYVNDDMDVVDLSQERLLVEDLMQLYKSQKFSDVTLRAGDHGFKVHKSILCSRAPGFKAFLQDDDHKAVNVVEVEATAAATKGMMNFIYSAEYPEKISVGDCLDLHIAAKKYGLKPLADYCLKVLRGLYAVEPFEGTDDVKAKIEEILKEYEKENKIETIRVFF